MKFVKRERHHTQVVSVCHVFQALCCLLFVVLTPLFWGCAPRTTAEIQEWGIVGYENVYNTTQTIDRNGVLIAESRSPAGLIPVYGYYTQEVVVPPETRDSHDVFSKSIDALMYVVVSGTVTYIVLKGFK